MKLINFMKNILTGLYISLKRFPATILLSISIMVLLIVVSEFRPAEDTLSKISMVLALGIPLSLSIKLFFEGRNEDKSLKCAAIYTISAIFLILYYFFFLKNLNMVDITRYIAVSLTLYLTFLFIPYFPRREQFEMYIITIISGFFITILYSLVLYGGLSAILFTLDKLLGIQIVSKIYYYTFLFVVFIFAVSYFLSVIPLKDRILSPKYYPRLLKILLLYIVMPLLSAYTIILYIYFGKIIVAMQWPEGLVSHLVLWYSVIITLVLFFITPIREENSWARRFLKIAPKTLLPLLLMMFISIGIRINAYGVTEPRYYVVILALWIFSMMLYLSFTKKLRNIILPFTLAIISLISVFGPLSSFSISKYSQNKRLEKILLQNNMLVEGSIQGNTNISKEDKANISSILDYFNRAHSLKETKYMPSDFKMEDMNKVLGFGFTNPMYESPDGYFYFSRNREQIPLEIKGYDYLFDARYLMDRNSTNSDPLNAVYDYGNAVIKINYNGKEIYSKDLSSFAKQIVNRHGIQQKGTNLSDDEMILEEENDKVKVRFIIQSISGRNNGSNQNIENESFEFYMMVKIK
jgi:hypothetical protein